MDCHAIFGWLAMTGNGSYFEESFMKKIYTKTIIVLILLPLLLQGCWIPTRPNAPAPQQPPEVPEPVATEPPPEAPPRPGQFTLRYDPDFTMNPILALSRDNIMLTSFLYESLFILDDNLTAVPLLCADWSTEDNITFIFEIMPDIAMHDGSVLTADDVAYSIRQARNHQRSRHRSKLRSVSEIHSDGELTVTITLENPNARFNRLLDIPIIKNDSIDSRIPPGTGPYHFPTEDAMRLTRFSGYRYFSDLPLYIIHLIEARDSDLTDLFDSGELSLLWDDPTGAFDIRINRFHDTYFFNTTTIQYLGFNTNSFVLSNNDVRRAVGCAIDRQFIVENIMNMPRLGQTIASPVAISPIFDMYDSDWEIRGDLLIEMGLLIERAGLIDAEYTGFLSMPDGHGGFRRFTLDFIVNIENSHKRDAAQNIAENLRQFGFNVNVRELQWSEFTAALQEGRFDMYYGETQLGADFDLSPLLLPGEANLNFGNTGINAFRPLIHDFLAAETGEEVSLAGEQLNLAILQHAPFIPILYKRHAIYSHVGAIVDASPSQSGVFHNFHEWSIDLLMLN
jgi:ABC-type transport system substrate-binding protein